MVIESSDFRKLHNWTEWWITLSGIRCIFGQGQMGSVTMISHVEVHHQVGETGGKICHLLNQKRSMTLSQIKKQLDPGQIVDFALGWLLREEKISVTRVKKTLTVQLK